MRTMNIKALVLGTFVAGASLVAGSASGYESPVPGATGFAGVYGVVPPDQAEFLTPPDRIMSVAKNGAPTEIWEALEHGERVECVDCISVVAPLLYDQNATSREIAAWWLRRRIFGVFGPGEVYEQTLNTLKGDPIAQRRAYAATALGEFFFAPGIPACATALATDADPGVRAAAALALGRLNDDGGGALGKALGDGDASVRLAALKSATQINSFSSVASVAGVLGDGDANVRRQALQVLDVMGAKDSAAGVLSLAQNDGNAEVRLAACHALGAFHDPATRGPLNQIAASDSSSLVRDAAQIALLRL